MSKEIKTLRRSVKKIVIIFVKILTRRSLKKRKKKRSLSSNDFASIVKSLIIISFKDKEYVLSRYKIQKILDDRTALSLSFNDFSINSYDENSNYNFKYNIVEDLLRSL